MGSDQPRGEGTEGGALGAVGKPVCSSGRPWKGMPRLRRRGGLDGGSAHGQGDWHLSPRAGPWEDTRRLPSPMPQKDKPGLGVVPRCVASHTDATLPAGLANGAGGVGNAVFWRGFCIKCNR